MDFYQFIAASTAISALYLGNSRVGIESKPLYDGFITIVYVDDDRACDFICHGGSYGHMDGLLEGADGPFASEYDNVTGYLTATEVVRKVTEYIDDILKEIA